MTGPIIRNPEVLSEEHLPEQVIHRFNQLKVVAGSVEPLLHGKSSKTVLMHGPSGSGKTTTARFLLDKLKEQDHRIRTAYVNCWRFSSRFDCLTAVAQGLGLPKTIGKISSSELRFKIESIAERTPCCVVLDEADQLEMKRVIREIGETRAALILIMIDDRDLFRLSEAIRSRLGPIERVHFPTYTISELEDIIESRAELALMSGKLNKGQIRRIAVCAGGNAHLAMESLRLAAERAEEKNSLRILDEHVSFAVENARRSYHTKSLGRLNEHQRLLLEIIKEAGEIPTGEVHKKFRERAQNPVSERTLRNYLHKLEKYGFVKAKGFGRWRVFEVR